MSDDTQDLEVAVTAVNGAQVICVRGEVDLATSPKLRELLLASAKQLRDVVRIDLSQVPYMDSSGVGTMVFIKRAVERAGARVVLIGLQPRVRSLFEITHLDKFFTIVGTVDEATAP